MSREYSITPQTRKVTIHTLDLVDRGKWIKPEQMVKFFSLNKTDANPKFTSLGWAGIASITVDLQGLRDAGENIDNPHNPTAYINNLARIYEKYALGVEIIDSEEIVETPANALEWFNENKPKKSIKVDSIPSDAIALDDSSRRYSISFSQVYRYRNLTKSKGYCIEDYFCLASDAPECVKQALNY